MNKRYLSKEDLVELTGMTARPAQVKWLKSAGVPFKEVPNGPSRASRIIVTFEHVERVIIDGMGQARSTRPCYPWQHEAKKAE